MKDRRHLSLIYGFHMHTEVGTHVYTYVHAYTHMHTPTYPHIPLINGNAQSRLANY